MTRRALREVIFKKLYEIELTGQKSIPDGCTYGDTYTDGPEAGDSDCAYISEKLKSIIALLDVIDGCIEETSNGWKVRRMSKVDLSILRLAVYEMLYDDDIPVGVAVNEAVELAKRYGADDSASFINGILGNISRKKGAAS